MANDSETELRLEQAQVAAVVATAESFLHETNAGSDTRRLRNAFMHASKAFEDLDVPERTCARFVASNVLTRLNDVRGLRLPEAPAIGELEVVLATYIAQQAQLSPGLLSWDRTWSRTDVWYIADSYTAAVELKSYAAPLADPDPEPGEGPTMTVSTSLHRGTVEAVRARVGKREFSRYVEKAVLAQIAQDNLREILDDYQAQVGPANEEDLAAARAFLLGEDDAAGGNAA